MIMIYNWINFIEQLPIYSTLSYNVYVSWNYLCASSVHGDQSFHPILLKKWQGLIMWAGAAGVIGVCLLGQASISFIFLLISKYYIFGNK